METGTEDSVYLVISGGIVICKSLFIFRGLQVVQGADRPPVPRHLKDLVYRSTGISLFHTAKIWVSYCLVIEEFDICWGF